MTKTNKTANKLGPSKNTNYTEVKILSVKPQLEQRALFFNEGFKCLLELRKSLISVQIRSDTCSDPANTFRKILEFLSLHTPYTAAAKETLRPIHRRPLPLTLRENHSKTASILLDILWTWFFNIKAFQTVKEKGHSKNRWWCDSMPELQRQQLSSTNIPHDRSLSLVFSLNWAASQKIKDQRGTWLLPQAIFHQGTTGNLCLMAFQAEAAV